MSATYESQYLSKVVSIQKQLREAKIPFVLIGSICSMIYCINRDSPWRPVLVRSKSRVLPESLKIPDLDVLVPRTYLKLAHNIRRQNLYRGERINLELLSGECHIDWRPELPDSYLLHGKLRTKISSSYFTPDNIEMDNNTYTLMPLRTQLQLYCTIGGILRQKDYIVTAALRSISSPKDLIVIPEIEEFNSRRAIAYPNYSRWRNIGESIRGSLPYPGAAVLTAVGKKFQTAMMYNKDL